ncbi:MAG: hypothetical protein GAK45_00251 [Pseudomonas citronellolis]|nr:MAG: hypothetical protein GAK45_00251 [Pseudomonas citronellolis]
MFRPLLIAALSLGLLGCAQTPPASVHTTNPATSTLQGDAGRPAQAQWQRTELYFALGALDNPQRISEARWRQFLDQEVTPRFPDGFTVLDAYGQWRDRGAEQPERLATKLIVLLHPVGAGQERDIEAIRLAWKRITGDLSVLRLTQPAQVSF